MSCRVALVLVFAGCSLLSKAPPLDIRYYEPAVTRSGVSGEASRTKIRIGHVSSGSHLRSRIAYRTSPTAIELYDTRRWTEPPGDYVRRALERELVRRGALVTGGKALELEVEVIAFEEIRSPKLAGRVALRYLVIDDRDVVRQGVVEVERPAGPTFDSVVTAIGSALDEATRRVVAEALRSGS